LDIPSGAYRRLPRANSGVSDVESYHCEEVMGAASANSSITVTLGKYLYRHNILYFVLWNIGIVMVILVF